MYESFWRKRSSAGSLWVRHSQVGGVDSVFLLAAQTTIHCCSSLRYYKTTVFADLQSRGNEFHSAMRNVVLGKSTGSYSQVAQNAIKSLEWMLEHVTNPLAVESVTAHPGLEYKGIPDCVLHFRWEINVTKGIFLITKYSSFLNINDWTLLELKEIRVETT